MLEKLAEIVREQVEEVVVGEKPYYSICYLCELEPDNGFSPRCLATEAICNEARKKRDLKLARLSVLLVARGLPSLGASKKAMEAYENAVTEFNDARRSNKPLDAFQDKEDATWREWRELEYIVMGELDDLIAEAKEGTNDAV